MRLTDVLLIAGLALASGAIFWYRLRPLNKREPAGPSPAVIPETGKCEHGQTAGHWTPLRGAVPVHKTRQECRCPGPDGQAAES